jgi:Haem-binding domain
MSQTKGDCVAAKFRFRSFVWVVLILAVALVCVQFARPQLTNPPVTADLQAPDDVKAILKTSCYNCHSNETKLSWFDKPVPAIWLVARDVRDGRARLNFSDFAELPSGQQKGFLFETIGQIELGAMPLPQYERLHPEAAITPEQLATLKKYVGSLVPDKIATRDEIKGADEEYAKWIPGGADAATNVAPAPNGMAFMPDYKNWKAISSTERLDNYTLRQILGNDIAVKAVAENLSIHGRTERRLRRWPSTSSRMKRAWRSLENSFRSNSWFGTVRNTRRLSAGDLAGGGELT